jgi:hypothetical protein
MNTSTKSKSNAPAQSRKSKVKALYQEQGPEAAHTLGLRLKLKPSTLYSWCSAWRRAEGIKKTAKPKVTPPKAKAVKKPALKVEPAPKPSVNGAGEGSVATS